MLHEPGKLNYRITLSHETFTSDGMGGRVRTVTSYATVWSDIWSVSGSERQIYDQVEGSKLAKFVIRYRNDILLTDEINFKGARYNIRDLGKIDHNRQMFLWIVAESGVAQ